MELSDGLMKMVYSIALMDLRLNMLMFMNFGIKMVNIIA